MSTTDQLKRTVAPAKARNAEVSANKPRKLFDILCDQKFQSQMRMALPKTLTAERLTRIVMTECRKTPELANCSQDSFFGAILQCAQLGLEPGGALGHCYLLPYGKTCQLIIGYRGMIDLARRSGQIVSINAYVVNDKDDFEYELGLHPDIKHRPSPLADRGPVTYVYAVAVLKGGGVQFEVMSRAEVEAVRKQSKAGKSGPWSTHWDEMAKKTVIRRLFKYLPVSIEAMRAVEVDEKSDRGEAVSELDFIEAQYEDKGEKLQSVVPMEEPPATALEPEPTPEPVQQPTQPPIDESWVKAYEKGSEA